MAEAPTVASLLDDAARRLGHAGSTSPRLDGLLLLSRATRWRRAAVLAHPEWPVDGPAARRFQLLLERRLASEPMAYILGEREFYGRVFRSDRRALVPRPETEALVEIGIASVRRWREHGVEPRVVEVGTGTGAIALSVAAETGVRVLATDLSPEALSLARENATMLGQAERVQLVETDLLAGIGWPIHLLLANLPYLPSGRRLPRDVAEHEPAMALYGGPSGRELNERLLRQAAPILTPGGEVAVEMDEDGQGEPLAALARELYAGSRVEVRRDAAGLERVLYVRATAAPRAG